MLLKLKVFLLESGLRQKELSRLVGISQTRLSRIIQGHTRPCARERRLISEQLGVPQLRLFAARRVVKRKRQRKA